MVEPDILALIGDHETCCLLSEDGVLMLLDLDDDIHYFFV